MIMILIAVISALVAAIVYLNVRFYKEKKMFKVKVETLQQIIVEISQKQNGQLGQIKLSNELHKKMKSVNAILSDDVFKLNYELFEMLDQNNLLKKQS